MSTKHDILAAVVANVKKANGSKEMALALYMDILEALDWVDSDFQEEVELEHEIFTHQWVATKTPAYMEGSIETLAGTTL